jgi:hypothetical protein
MLRRSTGFKNALLGTNAFSAILANCYINIYSGTQPASADSAASGVLLMTITADGGGLNFDTPSAGVIAKDSTDWLGTGIAEGVAGWFRLYENTDDPALASTTKARIDGQIAISGAEWNMSSTAISVGSILEVYSFTYGL